MNGNDVFPVNNQIINQETEELKKISLQHGYRLSEDLFIKLRDMILTGQLPAGYVFPNENELCKMFEVGRGTLRESYSRLATLNFITRTKAGTYVNDAKTVQNSIPFATMVKASDTSDLMQFRRILEAEFAAIAAQKANDENIAKLEEYGDLMKTNIGNPVAITIYDTQLHLEIARISGNKLMYNVLETIRSNIESMIYSIYAKDDSSMLRATRFHEQIIGAIKAGDPDRARAAMYAHMENVKDDLTRQ